MNLSKRFPYLNFVRGIHWSSSDSPHQRSINGSFEVWFVVSLNKLLNGRIAGDLRRNVLLWRQYNDFWQLDLDITTTLQLSSNTEINVPKNQFLFSVFKQLKMRD